MVIFNGLSKSDLVVFNALTRCDLSEPVPSSSLAEVTGYHQVTVLQALGRLAASQIITRQRRRRGEPYRYNIEDDNALLDAKTGLLD